MSFKIEDLEKANMKKLVIEVSAEKFEEALDKAFRKNKNQISIQGFRKGKAPKALIEKLYGPSVFYEDAANILIPDEYAAVAEECGLDIVSRPEIDVEQIEKGKNFIFTAEVAVKPEVKLGEYKGIEVEAVDTTVTEDEIKAELNKALEQSSRLVKVTDRPVENGDTVNINFEGFADGKRFPVHSRERVMALGNISIYTEAEDLPLAKVLENVAKKFDNKAIDANAYSTPDQLHEFMGSVLENWDSERVHNSDIKKIISWYNILIGAGITDFTTKEEDEATEAPAEEEKKD